MLVDSLVEIAKDTTQKVSEYVTQSNMFDQLVNIENSYNGHMNLLLIIFGLGIALGGILVPLYVSFKQRKEFRDLEKKYKEVLKILKKEIENKLNDEFEEKIKEKTLELESEIKKELEYLKNLIKIESYLNIGALFFSERHVESSFAQLIQALGLSLQSGVFERIEQLISELDAFIEIPDIIDYIKVESDLEFKMSDFNDSIEGFAEEDDIKSTYVTRIKHKIKMINEKNDQRIVNNNESQNTENPPQGSD